MAQDKPQQERFMPTVNEHTQMSDGVRLHTIDPDPRTDIDVFDDDREPKLVGEVDEDE